MRDFDLLSQLEEELEIKSEHMDYLDNTIPGSESIFYTNKNDKITGISLCSFNKDKYEIILGIIGEFKNLRKLKIAEVEFLNLDFIVKLENLTSLTLSSNYLSDIDSIAVLKNLTELVLIENLITNINCLVELSNLQILHLRNNKISDINCLQKLSQLIELGIGGNPILNISVINTLENLQFLFLWGLNLNDISFLKPLKNLKGLDLSNNNIEIIPEWIFDHEMTITLEGRPTNSGELNLSNNPIKNPPVEILTQGKEAIKRYLEKINAEGVDYIFEVKLTLVGEGNAGKTSLQKRLIDPKAILPSGDSRTRGIKIYDWIFNKIEEKNHIAHIWDFGGQDVYYPVHRFFLTEDSIFVLLASTRQTSHNFEYWIPTIYQFGGKSPIILGQTCHDGNKIAWNDLGYYVGHENFNIIKTHEFPYIELDLPNQNFGLKEMSKTIIDQITSLPHYGKGVPRSWIPVRDILFNESADNACITFEKFSEICKYSNPKAFSKLIDIVDCAKFLHKIGVILWYSDNTDLKDWIILQPEWAMTAVYKIIDDDSIQKRKGNILSEDFERLWTNKCYEGKHLILKKMLEVFKIAFPKKHKKEDYIIPARLVSMPTSSKWKDNEPYLRLIYEFEFMPRGLVNQLSAELSRYIPTDFEVWNNAVNLVDDSSRCQIEEDFYKRNITIKSKGKDARSLIKVIMNSLKDIIDGYKGVKEKILVPCNCIICNTKSKSENFPYDKLLDWSTKRDKVTCNESGDNISIDSLLYNVGLTNPLKKNNENKKMKKLFVSYSKHDENYLQDFEDHLVTLKGEGLVTFNCREIEFGKEWDEEIKKQIDECDIMVCLISVKFLNTDYITKIEIPKAIKQNKMIIPIIIKACDWETSELGKYQAAQRGKVVSLDNNLRLLGKIKGHTEEEKAEFWTNIIKEFRRKIFNK